MWAKRLISGLFAVLLAGSVQAQSPFSAAVTVNGGIVTWYDIDQRARMLEVIGQASDSEKAAREALIDERLYAFAARQLGISITEDQIKEGMAEFAARANLETDKFVEALAAEGVEPETFRAFVASGLLWRLVIQQKFQAKAFVSEAELDTAMALGTTSVGASVLLSELVLPLQPGQEDLARELAADLSARIKTNAEFEEAALTYSAAPSRANGGKLDWIPLANLPEDVGKTMLTMSAGQVTPPIELGNSIVIFQLRGIRDNRAVSARTIAYDYATYLIPGGQSETAVAEARRLAASVDTCNDLQALVRNQPSERFNRKVVAVGKVARDVSLELAKLDRNEISTALTAGQGGEYLMMVMLCNRTNALTEGNREEVRAALYNQRMEAFGQGFVQELRGDAIIVYK